jgi:ribosomal protein S18 acetylase RimI-like enzyme
MPPLRVPQGLLGPLRELAALRIRPATEEDAGELLALRRRLDTETSFMLLEPDERTTAVEEKREQLRRFAPAGNRAVLVAEDGGRLVGLVEVLGGRFRHECRTAQLVLGVLREHAGRDVGSALLECAERWARRRGISRLELTVMRHNRAAIHLYRELGFETECVRRRALLVGGSPVDELYMAKLLEPGDSPT